MRPSKFQSHDWLAINIRRGNDINLAFNKALNEATGQQSPDTFHMKLG